MALKFAANISTLFTEFPLEERFKKAQELGFKAVEIQDVYSLSTESVQAAATAAGVEVILLNSFRGEEKDDCGLAAIPSREDDFVKSIAKTKTYTFALRCKQVHVLSGLNSPKFTEEEKLDVFIRNLQFTADMFEEYLMDGLIEPICPEVNAEYYLSDFDKAVEVIQKVDKDNIKLLLDIYHLHKITGDVETNLPKYYKYAGHIQISQDPGRCEPFQPGGQINYEKVFNFLKAQKYDGYIGLEYFPTGSTEASLEWIKNYM